MNLDKNIDSLSHVTNPHGFVCVEVNGPLYQLSPAKSHQLTSEFLRNVETIKLERLKYRNGTHHPALVGMQISLMAKKHNINNNSY
jgi:hypothetical protein